MLNRTLDSNYVALGDSHFVIDSTLSGLCILFDNDPVVLDMIKVLGDSIFMAHMVDTNLDTTYYADTFYDTLDCDTTWRCDTIWYPDTLDPDSIVVFNCRLDSNCWFVVDSVDTTGMDVDTIIYKGDNLDLFSRDSVAILIDSSASYTYIYLRDTIDDIFFKN